MKLESQTVFMVDDDPVMLFLWGDILRSAGHRIEAFEQAETLLKRLTEADRGCVVVDLRMPGLNGLELQRALLTLGITLPLIFVSGSGDVPSAVNAMKGGAIDFLSKPVNPRELCEVVEQALKSDATMAKERRQRAHARALWSGLSPRERDVCRLVARGLADKQIAAELGTAPPTVQAQRVKAMQKLQLSSAAEVVRLLDQAGDMD